MVKIQFYNIKGSSNLIEMGPFDSVVCDGVEIVGVEGEKELTLGSYDQDHEGWHVYERADAPLFLRYFEVVAHLLTDSKSLNQIGASQFFDPAGQDSWEGLIFDEYEVNGERV